MLSNSGVNINDSIQVKNHLNIYYNAQFSYFAYQQVISNCATFAGSYVLPRKGTEADFVESAYRFGFNGKENDPEGMGGGGSTYDYGFRIYNSRLGKFLSVDPLTSSYPWYTPYQFAGNKPIKFVDIDGLEEGELEISGDNPKIATLTWTKIYIVVNEGAHQVVSHHKINFDEINKIYNSGENVVYTNVLPGTKDQNGNYVTVGLSTEKQFNAGAAYKIYIKYDIKQEEGACTLADANQAIQANPVLYGAIMNQSGPGNYAGTMEFPTAAMGTVSKQSEQDVIYTNPQVYGNNPMNLNLNTHGIDESGAMAHEVGHNFGLSHKKGDYSQPGLMNNDQRLLPPTRENNKDIINNNNQNI